MDWVIGVLRAIVPQISPQLRQMLVGWIDDFAKKAAETDNPWDDLLAALLKVLVGS